MSLNAPQTSLRRFGRNAALLGCACLAAMTLGSCSRNPRTALAITATSWVGPDLVVTTECATEVDADVGVDSGGSGLTEVTLWGKPALGRCSPTIEVSLPPGTSRIVDGTTSTVIDLEPAPSGS